MGTKKIGGPHYWPNLVIQSEITVHLKTQVSNCWLNVLCQRAQIYMGEHRCQIH